MVSFNAANVRHLWRSIMENVIVIDQCIVRAMVEAQDAGLTFEQFMEMVNVAHEQYAILPDGEAS